MCLFEIWTKKLHFKSQFAYPMNSKLKNFKSKNCKYDQMSLAFDENAWISVKDEWIIFINETTLGKFFKFIVKNISKFPILLQLSAKWWMNLRNFKNLK